MPGAALAAAPRQRRRAEQRAGRATLHRDAEECPGEGPRLSAIPKWSRNYCRNIVLNMV